MKVGQPVPAADARVAAAVGDPRVVARPQDEQGFGVELQDGARSVEARGPDGGQGPGGGIRVSEFQVERADLKKGEGKRGV